MSRTPNWLMDFVMTTTHAVWRYRWLICVGLVTVAGVWLWARNGV